MKFNLDLPDSLSTELIDEAALNAQNFLTAFATDEAFTENIRISFGDLINPKTVEELRQQWIAGNFEGLPRIESRSTSEINGANGAFASATNTIYLSREYISQNADNPRAIAKVLLEEIGHYLDWRINTLDAAGDEGAIFSALVQGETLNAPQMKLLKAEDDSATVELDGQQIIIEQSAIDLQNWINNLRGALPFLDYNFIISGEQAKFENVTLEIGEFFDSFLTSILIDVNRVVDPIKPIIDALTKNIDFLTNPLPNGLEARNILDFEKEATPNDVTLLDLLKQFGDVTGRFNLGSTITFIKSIREVLNIIDFVSTVQQTGKVSLGSFNYNLGNSSIDITSLAPNAYSQVSALVPGFDSRIKSLPGLSLPIISDPSKVFQLLVGGQTDLFTYRMPSFGLSVSNIPFLNVPIIPPLFAKGRIENIKFDSSLAFGFDTEGLRSTGNGFYVSDRDGTGLDIPEFTFLSEIGIGLSLDAGIIEAFGRGVIAGGAAFNLRDPNSDGKIRVNEFSTQLFDQVNGTITASLRATLETPLAYYIDRIRDNPILAVNPVGGILVDLAKREGGWIGEGGEFVGRTSKRVVNVVERFLNWLGEGFERITGQKVETFFDESKPSSVLLKLESPEVKLWSGDLFSSGGNSVSISKGPSSITATEGRDVIPGTPGKDYILGLGGDDELHGGAGDDRLDGGTGNDFLYGEDDNDKLYGNEGVDFLYGGSGTDLLVGEADKDWLIGGDNDDRLIGGDGKDVALYTTASRSVEVNLRTGTASGGAGNDVLVSIEEVVGSAFNDALEGDDTDNYLSGGSGMDFLHGYGGNDTLNGGLGVDILSGGAGDDSIHGGDDFDILTYGGSASSGVVVNLNTGTGSGGAGNDRFQGIEAVYGSYYDDTLVGDSNANQFKGVEGDDTIIGNSGNDTLEGNRGDDWLNGGTGDDGIFGGEGFDSATYEDAPSGVGVNLSTGIASGGHGNDTLTYVEAVYGSAHADNLSGGSGNDYLYGKDGFDRLTGRAGNDFLDGGEGHDLALYEDAPSKVEVYLSTGIASGGAGNDVLVSIEAAGGSAFGDRLFGSDVANSLYGGDGNDYLDGGGGSDDLFAENGDDYLDGGGASDRMIGGPGDDIYIIDDVTDLVSEQVGEGNDQAISTITYSLSSEVEALVLTGSNPIDGTGNGLDNYIEGNDAANTLTGDAGNDRLNGKGGKDQLFGNVGSDGLDGGTGDDTLNGGDGDDLYTVDSSGDVVIEDSSTGGGDTVYASTNYTLGANVEYMILVGNRGLNGTGNTLNNEIIGTEANDTLDGGTGGIDTLYGSAGNDTYIVDSTTDIIQEFSTTGIDTVKSSVSYTLGAELENLSLTGTSAINGTGNTLSNTITGNGASNSLDGAAGNDTLIGELGNDILVGGTENDILTGGVGADSLTGGSGKDVFVFKSKTEGKDTITDFSVVDDTIQVSKVGFDDGLTVGRAIAAAQFIMGAGAGDTSDRFIYNKSTGALFFDVDGKGGITQMQIAALSTNLAMSNADIFVIA